MSNFEINQIVWWFHCDSAAGNVYPSWLNLCAGKIVWISQEEDIMHIYIDGEANIFTVLQDSEKVFSNKDEAIDSLIRRISEMKN